jgi:hypothetical protein
MMRGAEVSGGFSRNVNLKDERTRLVDFVRRVAKLAAAEIRLDEGWQAANRKCRAAMTRKTYWGNQVLLVARLSNTASLQESERNRQ